MNDDASARRVRLSVVLHRDRDPDGTDPDYGRRPVVDLGVVLAGDEFPTPGGEHNVLLGEVEVPGDAEVTPSQVIITVPHGSPYAGIRDDPTGTRGPRLFVGAKEILDVAGDPEYAGLGITLVRDERAGSGGPAGNRRQ